MDRRSFLCQGALLAPTAYAQPSALRLDADPFTLGIASGLASQSRIVLWTRLAPRPREPLGGLPPQVVGVRWQLAQDEGFARIVREGEALARPEHAHSVHVALEALPPDRHYFYRFRCADAWSPIGRTRTPPAPGADVTRLRLALAACQHYEQGNFAAHADLARRDVDLVLFAGDYIYEGSNPRYRVRSHEAGVPRNLDAYRQRHVTYKLDPDLRASHAAHPWLLAWDDHEVENDYAGPLGSRGVVADPAAFAAIRRAAYQAYFEHMPVAPELLSLGPVGGFRNHVTWGRLADLWTLDGRQFRSAQACNPPGRAGGRTLFDCDELQDPQRTILGAEQERWIAGELAASQRGWKLLTQGSQVTPGGIKAPMLGRSIFSDGWDGYPHARQRLLDAMGTAPGGDVICLGGDVHRHVAARLRADAADPRSAVIASEFCCSSISSRGQLGTAVALMRAANPDLLHARGDERGYALIELSPQVVHCNFLATAQPADDSGALRLQARFVVERGRAGPQLERGA